MKLVIVGATGNLGTSIITRALEDPKVEEITGISRRLPDWKPERTTWVQADVVSDNLEKLFEGADVVIHLAWAIQPSHDPDLMEQINVSGSRRVFEVAGRAGAGRLVYASSVGAYSAGAGTPVEESWPTEGIPTSIYSRHKAAVERELDKVEERFPDLETVRIRPALIFNPRAASEIRRLFAGPFLPGILLRYKRIPIAPSIRGLHFQAVHALDAADAFLSASDSDATGAFNIAANPIISRDQIAEVFEAKTIAIPTGVTRKLASASWHLRLQPSEPGWIDLAVKSPLMSSERARRELDWAPSRTSTEALDELIDGMAFNQGFDTPPLLKSNPRRRLRELATRVGARQGT